MYQRNAMTLAAGVAGAFLAACSEAPKPTAPSVITSLEAAAAKGGAGGSSPVIALAITIADVDAGGNLMGIASDGQGPYIDGVGGVTASLTQYGNLAFDVAAGGTRKHPTCATRPIIYHFDNPVDPANTYRPDDSECFISFHFSTGATASNPWIPIQDLGVNGNPASECGYMGNNLQNSTTKWLVSFKKGHEATDPVSYAVFTRVSVSPDAWTVQPVGSCSAISNVGALRSDDGSVLYGYYYLPFLMTLRPK
jgi:hypothetical protein